MSGPRIILHLGTHKTGSTSIQKTLWRALVFVFSAEDMTAPDFPQDALARAAAFFRGFSDRVEAVAYARPPLAFMTSAYLQRLRELKPAALDFAPDTLWPGYRARFEKLDTVFGRGATTLRAFDRTTLEGGDVVRDFLGLAAPAPVPHSPSLRSNDSLSLPALLYARLAVEAGVGTGFAEEEAELLRGLEARRLRALTGPPLVIDEGVLAPVRAARTEDLAWMERRLGRALPDAAIGAGLTEAREMLSLARAALPRAAELPAPAAPGLPQRLWRRLRRAARA